ncbi:MAG: hypothetical protein RO257_03865 [Candidatus Kapabacteria bacterium]|nr:hypothetical protein [Candidatus Kapabacteria bacterium]
MKSSKKYFRILSTRFTHTQFKKLSNLIILLVSFIIIISEMNYDAKSQGIMDCSGNLTCIPASSWTIVHDVVYHYDPCDIIVTFQYASCGDPITQYAIDIISIRTLQNNPVAPCFYPSTSITNEAIKVALAKLNEVENLPYPIMFDISVKTNACFEEIFNPINGEVLTPCSPICCVTRYGVKKEHWGLVVYEDYPDVDGSQIASCNDSCIQICSQGHPLAPTSIYFNDYLDQSLCELDCFWKLDGNAIVNDDDFIGPMDGNDFVVKTLRTEGEELLMERIRVDNNRKIDFKLNSWFAMPQITFDADYWGTVGSTIIDDPTIKIYRATGELPTDGKYKVFPWWISVNIQNGAGSQGIGAFNIWSEKEGYSEPFHGTESSSTMTKRFSILRNGNVGIGVEEPTSKLEIKGIGYDGLLSAFKINNSLNSPIFEIKDDGVVKAQKVYIGVGTPNPSYNLEVNGNTNIAGTAKISGDLKVNARIYTTEVIVQDPALWWPDFVFDQSYKLTSLSDISRFIKQNGHLPEVPSKDDIQKDGVNVVEMQMILLKKVEELTLHLIEMKNDNDVLRKEIENLKGNK